MSKYHLVSLMFVLLAILTMGVAAFLVISYSNETIGALINFVTTNDYAKLQQCGVGPYPAFDRIKADLPTVILPFIYIGIPALLIIISLLMFMGGYYHHRGNAAEAEHDRREQEEQREDRKVVEERHVVEKTEPGKKGATLHEKHTKVKTERE